MSDKEILRAYRICYENLKDILENEDGQVAKIDRLYIGEILNKLSTMYFDIYRELDSKDIEINVPGDLFGRLSDSPMADYMYYDEYSDDWYYLNCTELYNYYDWKEDSYFLDSVDKKENE